VLSNVCVTLNSSTLNSSTPLVHFLHFKAPYDYASAFVTASSITSPIANPSTGEYVGQVLHDYLPLGLGTCVRGLKEPLSFLITPGEDVMGGDTVVGPSKVEDWRSSPLSDILFPNESESREKHFFETEVLSELKAGKRGQKKFSMRREDGSEEDICIVFAPVVVRILLGMNPSRFEAPINGSDAFVYSVAVGKPCADFKTPFETVQNWVNQDLRSIGIIYTTLNVVVTLLFVMFSAVAAMYIGEFL
jgi:hypothetical protein